MQPNQKLVVCGVLLCIGLVNLLLPQYIIAATSWWQAFREDNFDQPDLEKMVDDALRRRRRDMTVTGYRIVGGMLIAFAVVLWFVAK